LVGGITTGSSLTEVIATKEMQLITMTTATNNFFIVGRENLHSQTKYQISNLK